MTLIIYCILIVAASVAGGLIPIYLKLTHRPMQILLSLVSGVMLGVALLHLVPHAWVEFAEAGEGSSLDALMLWLLGGFLTMFLLERFFCFHHHETAEAAGGAAASACVHGPEDHHHVHHTHRHSLGWAGAAVGLGVHSVLEGVAIAAAIEAESHGADHGVALAGLGTFLVIVLHKPFDSLTIAALMAANRRPQWLRHVVNALFAAIVPVGAALFLLGLNAAGAEAHLLIGAALAFSAGMFLCIALSDLLPELQFHQHDRINLTLALLAGLAAAYAIGLFEGDLHEHGGDSRGHEHHDHADDGHAHE